MALGFLVYLAWSLHASLGEVLSQTNGIYLVASVFFWIGAHLVSPFLSALSLSRQHQVISYETAFRIHARNIIARYIPGGVWHTVGRVADFSDRGLSPRRIAGFVFLENSLAVSITLALGGASVWYFYGDGWGIIGAIGFFAGLIGLVMSRFIVNRWVVSGSEKISFAIYTGCIVAVGFFWAFAVAAFLLYLHAFPGWALSVSWLQIGGAYLLAWGLGFLAVFAPQGVGVFEAVLANLISDSLPLATTAVLISGFRLIMLCADTAVWFASRPIFSRRR
ncbi:hypothetical protein [Sulfuricaulis sp.]|uniref:hypothetical protein n=1 Tax=Sulfuricaulis sp. TaxID=2003553 RepID=UPI0025DF7FA0|nr:hypothetical protein [Sulfuricaulis sp.]